MELGILCNVKIRVMLVRQWPFVFRFYFCTVSSSQRVSPWIRWLYNIIVKELGTPTANIHDLISK